MKHSRFAWAALFLLPFPLFPQTATSSGFNRPPAGVDEALRERIRQFYELEQQGRFRQAEALVCEESRDRYYDMEKRRWTSVELIDIVYENNFTRARASAALGTFLNTFTGPLAVKAPLPSLWRLEKDGWCRYFPEPSRDGIVTPFGIMRPAPSNTPQAPVNPFVNAPKMPASAEELQAMVKLSRSSVTLPVSGGAEEVEIDNAMPGQVELRLSSPNVAGLEASLSSKIIKGGEKAVLKLTYKPSPQAAPPPNCTVRIVVDPIGTEKFVRVEFQK
jgi:hypothetical protein